MTAFLSGVLLGSLRKVWPWKEALETVVIRGKEKVIKSQNFLPEMSSHTAIALGTMAFGAGLIILMNRLARTDSLGGDK